MISKYSNAPRFHVLVEHPVWTIFNLTFLIASLPTNLVCIEIFLFIEIGFLTVVVCYFAAADGAQSASIALKKTGGAACFIAGLIGWYLTFAPLLKDSLVELPLGDTSKSFAKSRKAEQPITHGEGDGMVQERWEWVGIGRSGGRLVQTLATNRA